VIALCGYISIAILGVVYTVTNLADISIGTRVFVTTTFMCIPAYLFTCIIFGSLFIANNYSFYDPVGVNRHERDQNKGKMFKKTWIPLTLKDWIRAVSYVVILLIAFVYGAANIIMYKP